MATAKITKTTVDGLPAGSVLWDTEVRGFGVRRQSRDPVFVLKARVAGKQKFLTIGRHGAPWTVETARKEARRLLGDVAAGREPMTARMIEEQREQEAEAEESARFGAIVADFIKQYAQPRNRSWKDTERVLTTGPLAGWQDRNIASITRADVVAATDALVAAGHPVAANRLLAAVRKLLNWCADRSIIAHSPALGMKAPTPEKSRDRVLSDTELAAVWHAAEAAGYPFGAGLRVLILTGQRRTEVFAARWAEFDLAGMTWTIPRERAKNDREHIVPLSPAVVALLSSLPKIIGRDETGQPTEPEFVFTTTGTSPFSGFNKSFDRLTRAAADLFAKAASERGAVVDPMRPWVMHDLRRTFASGCARRGVPVHVVEKLLNHVSGTHSGIVGVYQKHEYEPERRQAANDWADHVLALVARGQADG